MINLFWSKYDDEIDYETWRNKKIDISPFHHLSLASHKKNKTILYSYQKFNKGQIPIHIEIKDADIYFPAKEAYKCLTNGHSIAHIADAVRLKSASENLGIVLDMDAVALRDFPLDDGWFATMPAKMTGGFAPKWGSSHPPIYVADKTWDGKALAAFPIKVSENNKKDIQSLSHQIMHTLLEKPKTNSNAWNYVIWTIKKIIKKDNKSKVYKPISFCPLPAWKGKGKCYSLEDPTRLNNKTELFGHILPSINDIINESYVVQHFFESAFQDASTVNNNFWLKVSKNSLLGKEAEYVMGKNWRFELSELSLNKN